MLPLACSLACIQIWHSVITATCSFTGRTEQDDVFWQTDVQQLNHWRSNSKRKWILMRKHPGGKIHCDCQSVIPSHIPSLLHLLSHDTQYVWLALWTLIDDIFENLASLRTVVLESVGFQCSLANFQVTLPKTVISWLSSGMGHLKKDMQQWQQKRCHFNRNYNLVSLMLCVLV